MKLTVLKIVMTAGILCAFAFGTAMHAYAQGCLSPSQARQAISAGKAASLSRISRSVRSAVGGEVVGANLCSRGGRLVYIVTILQSNGSAARVIADARSGALVGR